MLAALPHVAPRSEPPTDFEAAARFLAPVHEVRGLSTFQGRRLTGVIFRSD